jgi:hypothetical protein
MERVNYDGRFFRSVENSDNGEVGGDTRFSYHQEGDYLWATYAGGSVVLGQLLGEVAADGSLQFRYHHYNRAGEYRSGRCESTPQILPDGRIRLHERWQWTNGDRSSGTSIVEELPKR